MAKPTALVVEDEWLLLDVVEAELSDEGFHVLTAASGQEAMSTLNDAADNITCLLTDIRLGDGMDGWEIAKRARQLNSSLPVIYMTGDSHLQWQTNAVPNSVLLSKPFALSQRTVKLNRLVRP